MKKKEYLLTHLLPLLKLITFQKIKILEKKNIDDFFILIGTFYSQETAEFLKKRIKLELPSYNAKKLKIVKKSNKEINLISGPYRTINFIKNDYIQLKAFGFEELNIITNE